ncbi:MAG: 5-(carboxyamino)imidazole ribonucleotide mutase [Candidatus Krumholzibacteria bacterium]|jgi:5-(carboxyamino)imidazole ribonucleotide mutase|nr:5-(carboxyamino)imidazole ribonucleotide mutase [Candidatus Krumholzibacteria bacterium]MDP6669717.1 5-(carboxyamino)imidazole ribonucleotide mutase [Candidatus Krumholzibacteria bacterium]MDP6797999.1 5-(carboxyamino)imidazole ribonucleotide mutase [Candidatus Krumholzibacteria bacterium]MDP7021272.1 5-(carboxyamino)imidazole ribonucleotide mutase [Candidatus Krumholzibacteria bacterium]
MSEKARVGIVLGSKSDEALLEPMTDVLDRLGVVWESRVASAHRDPALVADFAGSAEERGLRAIIAVAGLSAALPGVVAAHTLLPVIGVPVQGGALQGVDALLSMAQMPRGVPVATVAIGKTGAVNAALLAGRILAVDDREVRDRLLAIMEEWKQS